MLKLKKSREKKKKKRKKKKMAALFSSSFIPFFHHKNQTLIEQVAMSSSTTREERREDVEQFVHEFLRSKSVDEEVLEYVKDFTLGPHFEEEETPDVESISENVGDMLEAFATEEEVRDMRERVGAGEDEWSCGGRCEAERRREKRRNGNEEAENIFGGFAKI